MSHTFSDEPKVVLLSIQNIASPSNPYSRLFAESIPFPFQPMSFSWQRALCSRYDIFHAHWPELLIRAKHPLKRSIQRLLLLALLLRCSARRIPIVRTVHNESPHEPKGRLEAWLLGLTDKFTSHWIVMNNDSHTPEGRPRYLIPHGDYRSWYDLPDRNKVKEGTFLFFGEIRPYKNVTRLCEAFIDLLELAPDAALTVMGRPGNADLAAQLRSYGHQTNRIDLRLTFVPDPDLVAAISSAHLVTLPYLRFHNSGAALLALSVGRPILVPDCVASRELVDEFGEEYIKLFHGELTSEALHSALEATRASDLPRPSMRQRDWSLLGRNVAKVYQDSLVRSCPTAEPAS